VDADLQRLAAAARAYLSEQLGPRAPSDVHLLARFDEKPLESEGVVAVFAFEPRRDATARRATATGEDQHYVVVGETEPNYFPGYGLDPDDAYSLHVGTRFMLELEVHRLDPGMEPPGARERLRTFVVHHLRTAVVTDEELAGLFRCQDDFYAVYRLVIDDKPVYFIGADCPPGCYELSHLPPQAVLRLHLGKLIRREAREEAEALAHSGGEHGHEHGACDHDARDHASHQAGADDMQRHDAPSHGPGAPTVDPRRDAP
jgi:hypothetical protein